MKCSNLTRCDKPILISFENIYICQNCDAIFQKGTKYIKDILIKCCDKMLILNLIFPSVIIVLDFVYKNVIYNFSKYIKFNI